MASGCRRSRVIAPPKLTSSTRASKVLGAPSQRALTMMSSGRRNRVSASLCGSGASSRSRQLPTAALCASRRRAGDQLAAPTNSATKRLAGRR